MELLRLNPIVSFAAGYHSILDSCMLSACMTEPTRERDWDNIATCHANDAYIRTWSFAKKVAQCFIL